MEHFYNNIAQNAAAKEPQTVAVLPPDLANQIAAGEVVERPSSVVKELVENSLDSGATQIEVAIEQGGRDRIRVEDNGCGMRHDDAKRAIERHATSKISQVDDLFSIATLGFRGEAVPSIGSVSRMEICTKPHGDVSGTRIVVEGGHLIVDEEVGVAAGTVIDVADLFFNTPARLKFLKTASTESRYITESLIRVALSRPDVKVKLIRDGKSALDFPQADSLKDRILQVLGRDVYDDIFPTFEYPSINGVICRGYFSRPGHKQRTAKNVYVFVNGRYVVDNTIRAAIKNAYGTLLEHGKHPSVVLFLEVPFEKLDINVHPAKTEVRFHDANSIYRAVYHSIADALAESPWVNFDASSPYATEMKLTPGAGRRLSEIAGGFKSGGARGWGPRPEGSSDTAQGGPAGGHGAGNRRPMFEPLNARHVELMGRLQNGTESGPGSIPSPFYQPPPDPQQHFGQGASPLLEPNRIPIGESESDDDGASAVSSHYFSSLKVIGQFRRMYIICEDRSGLVIIDQHAAHERVNFERLRVQYSSNHKDVSPLLVPFTLELDARRALTLSSHLEFFENSGFEIEHFGDNTFALKAVPSVLLNAKHEVIINDVLDDIEQLGRSTRLEEAMNDLLSRMACHKSVRGPTPLNIEECEALLHQMDTINFAANCPHGRPVYYRIPLDELEKSFDRR